MNTDNEYYTPSIEEFHPGFEHEFLEDIREVDTSKKPAHKFHVFMKKVGERWVKDIVRTEDSLGKYDELIRFKCVRVKRLSHECILECGWEETDRKSIFHHDWKVYRLKDDTDVFMEFCELIPNYTEPHAMIFEIEDGKVHHSEVSFTGKIMNVNELRTIMKQVGI